MKKISFSKNLFVGLFAIALSLGCNTNISNKNIDLKQNLASQKNQMFSPKTDTKINKNSFSKSLINQKLINSKNKFGIKVLPSDVITNVSGDIGLSKNSTLAVDDTGTPHVVWETKLPNIGFFDDFYSKYDDTNSIWTPYYRVTDTSSTKIEPKRPSIAVDPAGNIHMVFAHEKSIYYMGADATGVWLTTPVKLADVSTGDSLVKIVAGSSLLHVVWTNDGEVWYSSSSNGVTWNGADNVSRSSKNNSANPSLVVDTLNTPYVVWEEIQNGSHDIYYSKLLAPTLWSPQEKLSSQGSAGYNPSISLDGISRPSVVWEEANQGIKDIYYSRNNDNTDTTAWSTPVNISNTSFFSCSNAKVVSDIYGYSYAVWEQFTDGIYFSKMTNKDFTSIWDVPQKVSQGSVGKAYKNPSIARDLFGEGVHITWESNIDNPLFSIYHIKKTLNSTTSIVNRIVQVTTNKGVFQFVLFEDKMPVTTQNFVGLVANAFYNGLTFHRYDPLVEMIIQGGDPTGTGSGGSGTTIPLEINPTVGFDIPGVVGMARTPDPNTAESQFFITLDARPEFNNNYAAFGLVTSGFNVVLDLVAGDVMTDVQLLP
ncbi:MAG: peptidylprolyl isomerase [Cyanobacteriota bacterium]